MTDFFSRYPHWLNVSLLALLLVLFGWALHAGSAEVSVAKGLHDYFRGLTSLEALVVGEVRLPRALLALTIGAILGLAGAALQGLLRNPLAEPGIIGVSNCAALGAVLVFYFGLHHVSPWALPAGGMLGALLSVVLIFLLAGRQRSLVSLILAGIAVNALGGALISLALNFAPNPYAMQEILFWLLGSVSNRSMHDFYLLLPFALSGCALILYCGRLLDALTLGEETAQSLGFPLTRLRWLLVVGIALAVGGAVSVSGAIGFVGLVVPHLLRPLVGYQPRRLLPVSALGGAALLLASDMLVVALSQAGELKLGVITALIGGPFFLYLVFNSRSHWS